MQINVLCVFFIGNDRVSGVPKAAKITRIVQVQSWALRPDCNDNCTEFT